MMQAMDNVLGDLERGRIDRRQALALLAGMAVAAGAPAQEPASASTFRATQVDHIALRVTDVARSRDFYVRHLGLEVTSDNTPSTCFLRAGGGGDFLALFRGERAGMDHYCYSVESYTAASAVERLERAGLEPHREEGRVYFPDPDGLTVQVSR